jgi:malonate-semialdehyde dehydrogenase (acetylating)/methylmalonate-semialdehyde dehydrogenase
VGDETADALIAQAAPRVHALKIGPGDAPGMDMGPLITAQHATASRLRRHSA